MRARPTAGKRNRERDRIERQKDKMEKRQLKKLEKQGRDDQATDGEDPDIAGIEPGPQKLDPTLFGAESLSDPSTER